LGNVVEGPALEQIELENVGDRIAEVTEDIAAAVGVGTKISQAVFR
jgi:hypothetical protein